MDNIRRNTTIPRSACLFPKNDPRYIKWRESLKKRPPPWNKGKTKENNLSVKKISDTFKNKNIDNFFHWRENAKQNGIIPPSYPEFPHSKELAYLIGIILGDGHIDKFPRVDKLCITLGTDKPALITFTVSILKKIIGKQPYVYKTSYSNCVKIDLYQKHLSERLGVPTGNRRYFKNQLPSWIKNDKKNLIGYLRGLFEAEASLSIHLPTYTYNFSFSNMNEYLLDIVEKSLIELGFHPERRINAVRIRKKIEVFRLKELLHFRQYDLL